MSALTRRGLMAGSAAIAISTLARPHASSAAAPAAGRQVPGIYRYKIGDIEVTAVNDGAGTRKLDNTFVKNAELAEVQKALDNVFLPTETLTIPYTATVINTGNRLVLIDTGTGGANPTAGQLMQNFEAAGLDPKAIDTVIISHFHGDHIGGLRAPDGALAFPNAEIMVPEAEWDFWMDEGEMSRAPEAMKGAFQNVRKAFGSDTRDLQRFKADAELVPGITALPAYGHTPGHTIFRVASGSEQFMVLSDVTNHPALFVRHPMWQVAFDMDGAMAADTRRKVLDMAAQERALVAGYHFPFPAVGHIAKEGEGYELVPAAWRTEL
jgi:glyoxylase-like metal-dependent hydrolase (beta-lactamase superfamily II)